MGIQPGGSPPPTGFYVFPYGSNPSQGAGSVGTDFNNWTEQTIKNTLKGAPIDSYVNAQNTLNENVNQPISANSTQIGNNSVTLAGHENRITKLENGSTLSVFFVNDTWHKPAGYNWHQVFTLGGGAGGQGGENQSPFRGGQGGGRGGLDIEVYADSTLTGSGYTVTIGVGGLGAYSYYTDNYTRANSTSLGPNWRTDTPSSGQIISNQLEVQPQTNGWGENGSWNSYNSPMLCDDVNIQALIVPPSTALATNNYTGVYCAGPDTFSAGSKLVAFVGSTGSGCKMFTQVNTPPGTGIANGSQTGQTVVASSSTNFVTGQNINLIRKGNVFTGYINGVQVLTWTDTSHTVPTGVGNRRFGTIVEGNWPYFLPEYHSPGIGLITAINLDGLPGTSTTFAGAGISTQTGGGGVAGDTYGASGPESMGSGNTTTPTSGGGTGGNTSLANATAGGNGTGSTGGAAGTTAGTNGSDGTNVPTGQYGPAAGGGGGQGNGSGNGGVGGNGGFPGGPGGGGGACDATHSPGGGGNGSNGICWVISSVAHP